jgi:hypothetical protein
MIEIVKNEISLDGMRTVRVVSDLCPIPFPVKEGANVRRWDDELLGLHYVEMEYPSMDFVDVHFEGMEQFRRLLVWMFLPGERVSKVVEFAANWYFQQTHHRPQFAFMKRLPQGAENGTEVDGCILIQAEWALDGCVMIGG